MLVASRVKVFDARRCCCCQAVVPRTRRCSLQAPAAWTSIPRPLATMACLALLPATRWPRPPFPLPPPPHRRPLPQPPPVRAHCFASALQSCTTPCPCRHALRFECMLHMPLPLVLLPLAASAVGPAAVDPAAAGAAGMRAAEGSIAAPSSSAVLALSLGTFSSGAWLHRHAGACCSDNATHCCHFSLLDRCLIAARSCWPRGPNHGCFSWHRHSDFCFRRRAQ